ncbi:MAG: 16S rRNA (adenine(1518)-N(6)/adenine(1519)-N(6))-dimethyltransferase RsmA [Lachnospiraceae bacterium]|nr:16S rRNA (adenine(1518)-N(6)/adenine(1519)-N(6))-dimethyltransferase RsmA [Lachnospiraceae bacterium]
MNENTERQTLARATAEVLKKYDLSLKKGFGQNFLINAAVLESIVEGAGVTKDDALLEIGPGIGTLTMYLARAAGSVTAVEIDKRLIPILRDTLMGADNVRVIQNDILKLDIAALAEEMNGGRPFKVVANLPYYITTPIIMELLEGGAPIESITVMVQQEVADRMQAAPGTKDYGALTLAVQYYTTAHVITEVPPESFIPPPKVTSAVIRLDRHAEPPVAVRDPKLMFRLIRAAFNQRRKTLVNALANAPDTGLDKAEAARILEAAGLDPKVRGEKLGLAEFAALADAIMQKEDL